MNQLQILNQMHNQFELLTFDQVKVIQLQIHM